MNRLPSPLKTFLITTYLAAVLALALMLESGPLPPLVDLAIFAGLILVSEAMAVELPRAAHVSVTFSILMAGLILFGPPAALFILVKLFDLRRSIAWYKRLFNVSEYILATGAAAAIYMVLKGPVGGIVFLDFPWVLVPLAASATTFWLLNTGLVAIAIGLSEKSSPWNVWLANYRWLVPNYLVLAILGVALSVLYKSAGPAGILLLIMPLLVARHTFKIYLKLRSAYLDTIKAMVTVIEAKDHYTRGHSERVRKYARMIGEQMKLPDKQMETLEYAAVLHDVGKVGIDRKIINKPDKLTNEEFDIIRNHPYLGASILEEVKFLEEAVPALFHHHERLDGRGYGGGLAGDDIPFLARILCVADAYDCMTSYRPYRKPLKRKIALQELVKCAGTQFDPDVVHAFLAALKVKPEDIEELPRKAS